jgi:FtsP/CotA-like multicopper oxidase with cupredoxin domain
MLNFPRLGCLLPVLFLSLIAINANAASFRVQCPMATTLHPHDPADPTANPDGGRIKCQQIAGGDGFATMGDGTQTYLFSFGPLSGLVDILHAQPGTEPAAVFDTVSPTDLGVGDPNPSTTFNGAVGLTGDPDVLAGISGGATAVATVDATGIIDAVTVTNGGSGYIGPPSVTFSPPTTSGGLTAQGITTVSGGVVTGVSVTFTGTGYTSPPTVTIGPATNGCSGPNPPDQCLTGHVDPRTIMDVGVMNGNMPAPTFAIDEDDEFFLTLTNVGMIMRPDLFEQHTVHFHGYPNASAFYDGVPDASVAINIGGSFTYYYLAPEAGTYMWHCHITPPEHLQMGMVGQVYVRPRQNRVPANGNLYAGLVAQQIDPRTRSDCDADILCSAPVPPSDSGATHVSNKSGTPTLFAYNDGDGSTAYDVEYPINIHGFDPNFHFVGMTFNPEPFTDMKDKYFLLNGRSYPDTVGGYTCAASDPLPACAGKSAGTIVAGPMKTQSADGAEHYSQPLPTLINIPAGGRALLRFSDLDAQEMQTLASLGIPMRVVGYNAKILRDMDGNSMAYDTNSITLGGGESLDVILDASDTSKYHVGDTYYLYSPNLDHLSNDAENFGGLMTEVHICNAVDPATKACS